MTQQVPWGLWLSVLLGLLQGIRILSQNTTHLFLHLPNH